MLRADPDVGWINALRIYATVSCWLWTSRAYVGTGACLGLKVSLFGIRCTITPSYRNCTLACYWTTLAMAYGFALMRTRLLFQHTKTAMAHDTRLCADFNVDWIYILWYCVYIMKRYPVGFGRTERALVLVHRWIWMCHDLANNPPWHHRNSILACYSTTMAITYRSTLILMLVEYMYYAYMQRYRVGFGRKGSKLVLMHNSFWMRYCWCPIHLWHDRNCTPM